MWLLEFAREGGRLLQALKRKLGSSGWEEEARRFEVANHDAAQGKCDSIELKEFDGSRFGRREVDGSRLRRKLGASSLEWRKVDDSRLRQRELVRSRLWSMMRSQEVRHDSRIQRTEETLRLQPRTGKLGCSRMGQRELGGLRLEQREFGSFRLRRWGVE